MKHFYLGAITLSVGLFLSACGGGGSGGRSGPPGMDTTRPTPDTQPTAAQVIDQIGDIGRNADRLTMTTLHVWYRQGGTTVGHDCFAAVRCEPATDEFGLIFTPENLSAIPRNATIRNRDSRHGVPVAEYSGTSSTVLQFGSLTRPSSVDYRTLGGWMDYSFFTVNQWTFEGTNWQIWNGASTGMESGSNPVSGSATWTGAMVGRTRGPGYHEPGELVTGDSQLTFDFAGNDLDVALTGIRSDGGTTYVDLTWENVPVTNGKFGALGSVNVPTVEGEPTPRRVTDISGTFYGPNHEEVGGVFEQDQMIGAFGATRR